MNTTTTTLQNLRKPQIFPNNEWAPKNKWIHTETGVELIGCHCATPLDDCGCEDCQERHGYTAVYNKKTQTFDRIPNIL